MEEWSLGFARPKAEPVILEGPSSVEYLEQTNIIRSRVTLGGHAIERYLYSPFGLEENSRYRGFPYRWRPGTRGCDKSSLPSRSQSRQHRFLESDFGGRKNSRQKIEQLVGDEPIWLEKGHPGSALYMPLQRGIRAQCQCRRR